ncbi:MAG TPA: signal peptidase I [Rhizomicrobium sp.]|nr:signal peptidase I [Rhizomicrobium sp.]
MAFLNNRRWFLIYSFFFLGSIALALAALPLTVAPGGKFIAAAIQGAKLVLAIIGAVQAYFIARQWQPETQLSWYSRRWYLLAGGVIGVTALLFGLRTFAYHPFNMPSGSMYPSLQIGDAFLVSKAAYNFSAPQRGDVVVFWTPKYQVYFVKRVAGIPGDHVQMIGGRLFINEAKMPQRRIKDFSGSCDTGYGCLVPQFEEALPGGKTVRILDGVTDGPLDNTDLFEVPADSYFVLGDNRDNSDDSRREDVGFVPRSTIIGRVAYKYIAGGRWTWQSVN